VLLVAGLLVSTLTLRIRSQAATAREREQRITMVHMMTRSFAYRRGLKDIVDTAVSHVEVVYGTGAVLYLPAAAGGLKPAGGGHHPFAQSEREQAVAQWVHEHGRPAGYSTDTLPDSIGLYLPLTGGSRTLGVLGVALKERAPLTASLRQVLELFAAQAALALERALLEEVAENRRVAAEAERMRNTLLTTISHDLRTPLAAIAGAASALQDDAKVTDPAARRDLVQTIRDEADRLNAIIQDLLDLTRLEAGSTQLRREWYPVEELIGAVLTRLDARLYGRAVAVKLPATMLMVAVDPVLMEQVLVNLLENALKYTPEGTPIDIVAEGTEEGVRVSVQDRGPGIPVGEEERIFEKFYRISGSARIPGTGLGLPICRAIIMAHGGRIWVENRPDGGAAFRFLVPATGAADPPHTQSAA
jgi:two-component system sensor histidine kinase KdpD